MYFKKKKETHVLGVTEQQQKSLLILNVLVRNWVPFPYHFSAYEACLYFFASGLSFAMLEY